MELRTLSVWIASCLLSTTLLLTPSSALAHSRSLTLWWVVFNNPDACITDPNAVVRCGPPDIFGQDYLDSVHEEEPDPGLISTNAEAEVAVIYATGGKTDSDGWIRLVASIYRSEAGAELDLGGDNLVDPMGLGRAFENTGAEVHLVVRDHGRRARGNVLTQITNFLEPHCSDPNLNFFSGRRTCVDTQFVTFAPDESGSKDLFEFHDPSTPLQRGSARLFRNGDMLQAVVKTRVR